MKTIAYLLLTFIIFNPLFESRAQDIDIIGESFSMRQNYLAKSCDATGANSQQYTYPLLRDFIIIIEAMTTDSYVISVPNFSNTTDRSQFEDKYVKSPAVAAKSAVGGAPAVPAQPERKMFFLIPFNDFNKVCEKPIASHSFTAGIPTIPVKIRFGNGGEGTNPRYFRFEGNLSLGLSGGWKYSFGLKNQYSINALVGFTISSVDVDSLTTKGKVTSITSAASFSPHFGVVFDVKSFQFGLYTGIDFLYGEPNKHWVYRNQPWLGIGFGYSLFKTESNKKTN